MNTCEEFPYSDADRLVIWKWIKENCIEIGIKDYDEIAKAVNDYFFHGEAKQEWTDDILSGRNTPFRKHVKAMWKAQGNRKRAVHNAQAFSGRTETPWWRFW
jgi:hypothetical protein